MTIAEARLSSYTLVDTVRCVHEEIGRRRVTVSVHRTPSGFFRWEIPGEALRSNYYRHASDAAAVGIECARDAGYLVDCVLGPVAAMAVAKTYGI